jgi:DNA polymerase III epsilon subunit-like protein
MKQLREYIKHILLENKLSGNTIENVIDLLDGYSSNTWIFFDTETTGLQPSSSQLTEIGAIAVDPNAWSSESTVLDQFNEKISLTDESKRLLKDPESIERKAWEKSNMGGRNPLKDPQAILSMTRYGEKGRAYGEEQEVLDKFFEWADGFSNPLFIAQNASFDLKFLNVRSGGKLPKYPVLDTKQLMEMYLIPLLKTQTAAEAGDPAAQDLLDKLYIKKGNWGYHSSSMGVVSKAYGISIAGWHNALADVKMMMSMYRSVVETIRKGMSTDITGEQGKFLSRSHKRKKKRKKKTR